MAAAGYNSSNFPFFSRLPPELRNQIWHDALPNKINPALHFYKKGCWRPRYLSKAEDNYNSHNQENNLILEFCYDLLDDVSFGVPLVFVNREARGIALGWIHKQRGIRIRKPDNRKGPLIASSFDPKRDTLFVAHDQWDKLLGEPFDRLYKPAKPAMPDMRGKLYSIIPHIGRIAIPEALLRSEVAYVYDILEHFFNLSVLFIIVDAQPNIRSADNKIKVQRRWEYKSTQGGRFVWNRDRSRFDFRRGKYNINEALYSLIKEATKGLGEELDKSHDHSFEIRSIFAVRK